MKRSIFFVVLISTLILTIACGSSFDISDISTEVKPTEVTVENDKVIQEIVVADIGDTGDLLVSVYDKVSPGVVAIQTLSSEGGGLGSGFVYDKQGHIITNYHVIEDAVDFEIDFPSGEKVHGEVIGSDLDSDIAVVKVNVPSNVLVPLTLGSSDRLRVGQPVVAIGNPYGYKSTMTLGIVSAKGRTLESIRESPSGGLFSAGALIQTDASINPGNSGGPLLNLSGEVIGINRAIKTNIASQLGELENSGIGFAVTVDIVKRVVPELIANGKYDYPYLGISALPELSLMQMEILDISYSTGAYVMDVVPDSPADRAGVKSGSGLTDISGLRSGGDLIIAADGRPIQVFDELLSYLMTSKSPGDTIELTVLRDNQEIDLEVLLEGRP